MPVLLQEYAEFQFRRRHRQRRRGEVSSLRSNTPEPDDNSEGNLGINKSDKIPNVVDVMLIVRLTSK